MARFDKQALLRRVLSAAVLIPFTLWVIWTGKHMFSAFCIIGALLSFYEWRALVAKLKHSWVYLIAGAAYITLSGVCFYLLRKDFSFEVAMICIVLVWASDIGAYFTGKIIGGPKLAESISPNKTWAGFWGALFWPGVIAVIWALFYDFTEQTKMDFVLIYAFCFMTGALTGVVGQAGDLMISYFKRKSGLKDTGALIPGHGGILDRIDSLIPNIPVFYAIAMAVKYVFT